MATIAVLTLLAFVQAVFGRPIYIEAFYNLGNGLTSIVTAPQTTQIVHIRSMGALLPSEGLFETHSASSAPTLLNAVGASTTTPATPWTSKGALALAVVIPLVVVVILLVAWVAYKATLVRRRADSLATPTPVSPTPLIANIRVVAVTEIPAKFEGDETMRRVRDFWSPISPGPPELHVEYKNLEVAIGTAVDPTATHLPLLARDESGFFYDSDHPPTPGSDITEYTLRSPSSVDRDASSAASEAGHVEDVAHHGHILTNPVVDNGGVCTRPSTPISVRTVCTLTSIGSSLSLSTLETPKANRRQRPVLEAANQIPVIRIIEATPERPEKLCGYVQRFNSRAITTRQARLQNLI